MRQVHQHVRTNFMRHVFYAHELLEKITTVSIVFIRIFTFFVMISWFFWNGSVRYLWMGIKSRWLCLTVHLNIGWRHIWVGKYCTLPFQKNHGIITKNVKFWMKIVLTEVIFSSNSCAHVLRKLMCIGSVLLWKHAQAPPISVLIGVSTINALTCSTH